MGTYWCCYQSRRDRTDAGIRESVHSSVAGRELSADPLAPSITSPTQGPRSGHFTRPETDGLVGVNYVRAKYHNDSSQLHEDADSERSHTVISWMCGAKPLTVRHLQLFMHVLLLDLR